MVARRASNSPGQSKDSAEEFGTRGPNHEGWVADKPNSNGKYRGSIMVGGVRRWVTRDTKAEATAAIRRLANTGESMGFLASGNAPTVAEWMRHWLSTAARLKESTRASYDHNVEHYIIPNIGKHRLSALTPEHLERLYADMASGKLSLERTVGGVKVKKPIGASAIWNVHANIRRALNIALQRGIVHRNVALMVELPTKAPSKTKTFSRADTEAILTAAGGDRLAARYYLAMMFGPRPSEVLGLSWPDIDFDRSTVHVHRQLQSIRRQGLVLADLPKTKKGDRVIPIPPILLELFRRLRARQLAERAALGPEYFDFEWMGQPVALVFTQPDGKPISTRLDTANWGRLLTRAGVEHAERYRSRHTAASTMIAAGVDVAVVAEILGHEKKSFTYDTYVHPFEDDKKRAAETMAGMVPALPPEQQFEQQTNLTPGHVSGRKAPRIRGNSR